MKDQCPRISIVTPSFNEGAYIAETVETVRAQKYPNVEHIVVDGGSTDGTLGILRAYTDLTLVIERGCGYADAVNKGLKLTTGHAWVVLHAGEAFAPGALHRVAREIEPSTGQHLIVGRCEAVDEKGRLIGIEHPARFENQRRVFEIWKSQSIPLAAVFFSPEVWKDCGPMDETLGPAWVEYDVLCRFAQQYRFHFVDQVLALHRLQSPSSESPCLDEGIGVSRRYWGSSLTPTRWRLEVSLARYRFDRVGRGRRRLRKAGYKWGSGYRPSAMWQAAVGAAMAPEVAFYVAVYPRIRDWAARLARRALQRAGR